MGCKQCGTHAGGGAIHCDQLWWALNRYKLPTGRPLPPNTTWAKCIHITYRQAPTTDSKCSMQTTYHTLSGLCVTEIECGRGCTSEWDLGMRRLRGARAPSQSLDIQKIKYEVSDSEMSFGGEGEGGEEQDRAQLIAHFQVGRLSLELCPEGRGIRWSCV